MMSLRWSCQLAVLGLLSLAFNTQVSSLAAQYCSDLNTASGSGNYSQYQSNGLCYNFCLDDYAFAIVQGSECYCSDYVPGVTTSTSDCSSPCPGYPDDLCGNSDEGLFGYIAGVIKPSGTKGASSSSAPASSTHAPTQVVTVTADPGTVSVSVSVFITPSDTLTSSTPSSTDTPTTTPSSTTTSTSSLASDSTSSSPEPSLTWTPTPSVVISTVAGIPHTITVTPTVPPSSASKGEITKKGSKGLSTGAAVGLTVGLVALVALISAIVFFCWRRRQKEKAEEFTAVDNSRRGSSAGLGGPIPSRTMSENSRYVLNTDGRQVVESYESDIPGSRRSRLMPVDPRLNPHAPLYQRGDNKSRESVNTIRDDHDYSRPVHQQGPILRATNPDHHP